VQAVTGLTHLNTVRVYDYGRAEDGSFSYVMEYLDGPTRWGSVRCCRNSTVVKVWSLAFGHGRQDD
jgi:hypothetical protein